MKQPSVYILASERNGTSHNGVTSDLVGRTWRHKEHVVDGFTRKYDVTMLVRYELHGTMDSALVREKQIEAWKREWKIRLTEEPNPQWNDLWLEITGQLEVASKVTGSLPSQG